MIGWTSVNNVVSPHNIFILVKLSYSAYLMHRRNHPGPKTKSSYNFWLKQGGKDRDDFVWKKRKEINKKKQEKKNLGL